MRAVVRSTGHGVASDVEVELVLIQQNHWAHRSAQHATSTAPNQPNLCSFHDEGARAPRRGMQGGRFRTQP